MFNDEILILFTALTSSQLKRKMELCQEIIDALGTLEPGISNSATNVNFERSVAKIAQLHLNATESDLGSGDSENLIAEEMKSVRIAYKTLMQGSEAHSLMESRLKRIIDLIS